MRRKTFLVTSRLGLSSRTAARFVYLAKASKSKVWVEEDGEKRDAKNVLDLLRLAMHHRAMVTITIEGEDEDSVMAQISDLIESGLGLG